MIFAVLDVSLAVNLCINCSFFTFIYVINAHKKTWDTTDNKALKTKSYKHNNKNIITFSHIITLVVGIFPYRPTGSADICRTIVKCTLRITSKYARKKNLDSVSYPDRLQNLITCLLSQAYRPKYSRKFMHNFFSNPAHRRTNRQTDGNIHRPYL